MDFFWRGCRVSPCAEFRQRSRALTKPELQLFIIRTVFLEYGDTAEEYSGAMNSCRFLRHTTRNHSCRQSTPRQINFRPPVSHRLYNTHLGSAFQQRPYGDVPAPGVKTQNRDYASQRGAADDTIYALSTSAGRAAIAIIRISGPSALTVYRGLCPNKPEPRPRYATLRKIYNPQTKPRIQSFDALELELIDSGALVLYFPAPHTVTGEDVVELHIHGGPATVKAVLAAIPRAIATNPELSSEQAGMDGTVRYAEPGEFTRRAFYNGLLDLTQIEALGDTLSSETEQQRRLAVRGGSSTQSKRYDAWREELLQARGEMEALIDFAEDQDLEDSPAELCTSVAQRVRRLATRLRFNIANAARGELLRSGINIALVGAPNAGKSSLLNCIVGREAAIVSQEAGTTRDVVDVSLDIGGYLCRFGDLAGLRASASDDQPVSIGDIEKEGMKRAKDRALSADVVILIASSGMEASNQRKQFLLDPEVASLIAALDPKTQKVVFVLNKIDLLEPSAVQQICQTFMHDNADVFEHLKLTDDTAQAVFPISCKSASASHITNATDPGGIQRLLKGLANVFASLTSPLLSKEGHEVGGYSSSIDNSAWTDSLGATERQRLLLQQCLIHLEAFLKQVNVTNVRGSDVDVVLTTESLRSAADCLARVTGRMGAGVADVEEVLGVVFEK